MINVRSLYISSTDITNYTDNSSNVFYLKSPIRPLENNTLHFAIRSLGYDASVTNISSKQQNNFLSFVVKYKRAEKRYVENQFIDNILPGSYIRNYKIFIPDGLYSTLDNLFEYLNSSNVFIPSGINEDATKPEFYVNTNGDYVKNMIGVKMFFSTTLYGFEISIKFDKTYAKNIYQQNDDIFTLVEVNDTIESISLHDSNDDLLYKQLFTCYNRERDHIPCICPSFSLQYDDRNPPYNILFNITYNSSILLSEIDLSNYANYYYEGNTKFINAISNFQSNILYEINYPLQIFNHPSLNPNFIDITSNLLSDNISIDGNSRSLLIRHFPIGNNNGSNSYYIQYDNPSFKSFASNKNVLDSIEIKFSSEDNKWDFYNIKFLIEILIGEVENPSRKLITSTEQNVDKNLINEVNDFIYSNKTEKYHKRRR